MWAAKSSSVRCGLDRSLASGGALPPRPSPRPRDTPIIGKSIRFFGPSGQGFFSSFIDFFLVLFSNNALAGEIHADFYRRCPSLSVPLRPKTGAERGRS